MKFKATIPDLASAFNIGGGKGDSIRLKIDCYTDEINELLTYRGKEFVITLEESNVKIIDDKKTEKQNNMIYKLFDIIAKYNGLTSNDVKNVYKKKLEIESIGKIDKYKARDLIELMLDVIDDFEGIEKYREMNTTCEICGSAQSVHIHHIQTKGSGGKDNFGNLISLCFNHHTGQEGIHNLGVNTFVDRFNAKKIIRNYEKRGREWKLK